ncbi:MAG: helix-turn-helix domain-containing protein [Oscillospiraceae bacterium]|nr:helix-turn-helix domain-containing protein [Oscillospiraceae bacterium]
MIARGIRNLREARGVSQAELGRVLGVRQSTVAMWENGKNKPGHDTLLRLARFFGVGVDELCNSAPQKLRIPVLGRVQAGLPRTATEDIIGYEEIPAEMARLGEFFALQIKGDSMEPRFYEGDVVIVRRQEVVENGEIAIVLIGGEEATCKKFYRHDGGVSLVSLNTDYAPIFFANDEMSTTKVEVLGRVLELRAKF